MQEITPDIVKEVASTRNQLRVTNGWLQLKDAYVFDELLKRDIHIQLLVGEEEKLKKDFSLFNQLLEFKKKGVEMRFSTQDDEHPAILIDELKLLGPDQEIVASSSRIANFLQDWEKRWEEGTPFFPEGDDIRVTFECSNKQIFAGEEVSISWDVENATSVEVLGIGPVERLGREHLKLGDDSYFKLKATNNLQVAYGSLFVHVDKEATITYDLGFKNKRSQEFTSLVTAENYPDVFGVAADMPLQFTWAIDNAERVEVLPFGYDRAHGHVEFTPTESMEIEIITHGAMKNYRKKIHVQVFPIPVMDHELTEIAPEVLKGVNELLNSSLEKLQRDAEENDWFVKPGGLRELKKKELSRYKKLKKEMKSLGLAEFYKNINTKKLNTTARQKLLEKHKEDSAVKRYLESLNAYYD